MKRILSLLALSFPLLWGCDDKPNAVTGTNDETTTSLGVIYRLDGKPAAGAQVLIYAAGDTQTTPRVQGIVDDAGHVSLSGKLAAGSWNLLVRDADGTALFQDSLPCDGSKLTVLSDTLRRTGTVKGRVRVQAQDKPTIAWVQLLGAGRYANVDDSGRFAFDSVPSGRLTLAALTRVADYTPTFVSVQVVSDSTTDLGTIAMVYTGMQRVSDFAAAWDSLSGLVRISWTPPADSATILGYAVYRGLSTDPSTAKKIGFVDGAHEWIDTIYAFMGNGSLQTEASTLDSARISYWVSPAYPVKGESGRSGPATLRVKNPVLISMNPSLTPLGSTPAVTNAVLDSIGSGLGILTSQGTSPILWTSLDGNAWKSRALPEGSAPVFWGGKLWWLSHVDSGTIELDDGTGYPLLSSTRIHWYDGSKEDSVAQTFETNDSVTDAVLLPDGKRLIMMEKRAVMWEKGTAARDNGTGVIAGRGWDVSSPKPVLDADSSGAWWYRMYNVPGSYSTFWIRRVDGASRPALVESVLLQVLPDLDKPSSIDASTSQQVRAGEISEFPQLTVPQVGAAGFGNNIFALTQGQIYRIPVFGSSYFLVASPSTNLQSLQIWRGKLLVTDGSTLWSAPLASTP